MSEMSRSEIRVKDLEHRGVQFPAASDHSIETRITSYETIVERHAHEEPNRQNYCCFNFKSYVRELSEELEFHGMRYLLEEKSSLFERLLWGAIILASIICCIFLIIFIHQIHSKSPIFLAFSPTPHLNSEILFPALTICPPPKRIIDDKFRSLICDIQLANVTSVHIDEQFLHDLKESSPQVGDFLEKCSFEGNEFACSNLFQPVLTEFGLCYSFNRIEMLKDEETYNSKTFRTSKSGIFNSLQLLLKQKKADVDLNCVFGVVGFKLLIHNSSNIPTFSQHFLQISLSSITSIALTPKIFNTSKAIQEYDPDVRKCYFPHEKELRFFQFYSKENCLLECLVLYILEKCKCVPFYQKLNSKLTICGLDEMRCVLDTKRQFDLNIFRKEARCDCLMDCVKIKYDVNLSTINLDQQVEMNSTEYEFTHLSIFFQKDTLENLVRFEFYGKTDVMANIGGLLNFFIGSSFVTLVEILYSFTLKILCNKVIYGPWAGPASIEYNFVVK